MIAAVRVLVLALAAAALVVAVAIGVTGRDRAAGVRYACPMHPEVRADGPGECPICRMALERVGGHAAVAATRANAADMADYAATDNVRRHNIIDFVRRRSLLAPSRELRGPASVESDGTVKALFYADEIAVFDDDEAGTFIPSAEPSARVAVQRIAAEPAPWDRSTAFVRFRIGAAPQAALQAGRAGWVELPPRPRQVLSVPASAVLQSPEGPYVLAWTGTGFTFEKRPIVIGETYLKEGFAVVLSGLRANERVVSRATFFLEAERRSGAAADETGWSSL